MIKWALKETESYRQEQANIQAVTTAQLTTVLINVAHGLAGGKQQSFRPKAKDFLPYPNWTPSGSITDGPDEYTRLLLAQLGKTKKLPLHVMTALLAPPSTEP